MKPQEISSDATENGQEGAERHLDRANAIVRSWPEWKQAALCSLSGPVNVLNCISSERNEHRECPRT